MLGRRLLVLAAVLLGLAAVTTSLAPRERLQSSARPSGGAPQPELEPRDAREGGSNVSASTDIPSEPDVMELRAQRSKQRVEVEADKRVRLSVSSTEPGSVQVGTDGPVETMDPVSPARFDLLYESPRVLQIVVRDASGGNARTIGRLRVVAAS